jgi:molybdenum cofactor cytidylyltransferase
MSSLSYGVVILAAGQSQRMGQPKMLLPWRDTTVLGHLIRTWKNLGARQIVVVCAEDARAIREELDRLQFPKADRIFNPAPERGMFSSIGCAARWSGWNPNLTHWILTLGDQPHLQSQTLRSLLDLGSAHAKNICQPIHNGRRRHPVLLPKDAFISLGQASVADLKTFLQSRTHELAGVEVDDPGLDLDLDKPEDYERAKALSQRRRGR